jgi:hypothetical protein
MEEDHGGASSLFSWSDGGEPEEKAQRKKEEWGYKARVTPAPLFIPRGYGRGHGGSAPLPRPFLQASPCGGTLWGGGPVTVPLCQLWQ